MLLDPLGHIRVMTHGSSTQKMYPLIMVDIDNGATHFELMTSLEAKEVYLALNRLQYRYNTKVKQVYSDWGTQLTCSLLGKKSNFYQHKLGSLLGIYNNLPYCQFRNVCERKVAMAKRMVRQMLFGLPGPQKTAVQWSQLITSLAAAASMLNNMPYLDESNRLLLAPSNFLTP